ncbi:MAG TPA: hypothetical protein VJ935_11145 [Acidimicrobiia bacterium]|nr:hypothetical protein [Acidimicrobiia bacterium]
MALIVLGAAGLVWFFGGPARDEVDRAATASLEATPSSTIDSSGSTASIEGTWNVDTSVGSFTVEESTAATFVGFRVEEVLNSIGSATAVERTPDVTGFITIEGTALTCGGRGRPDCDCER